MYVIELGGLGLVAVCHRFCYGVGPFVVHHGLCGIMGYRLLFCFV